MEKVPIMVKEFFDRIVSEVSPTDNGDIQYLDLKGSRKVLYVIKKISEAAVRAGSGFLRGTKTEELQMWDGYHFVEVEENLLKDLITRSASKLGDRDAELLKFRNACYQQFRDLDHSYYLKVDAEKRKEKLIINFTNCTLTVDEDGNMQASALSCAVQPTISIPVAYDAKAECHKFDVYLTKVLPCESTRKALLEGVANMLIPYSHRMELNLQKCLELIGDRDCGKSVFVDIVKGIFGKENYVVKDLNRVTDAQDHQIADLKDKAVCICNDTNNRITNISTFKSMVSGEAVDADPKYKDSVTMDDYAKFLIVGNEHIQALHADNAFYKRLLIIPFPISIPEDQQNPKLAKEIVNDELPGVVNRILTALVRLLKNGHPTVSDSMKIALEEARFGGNHMAAFLESQGYVKCSDQSTSLKSMYEDYRFYCRQNRLTQIVSSDRKFETILEAAGFEKMKKNNTVHFRMNSLKKTE